MKEKICIYCEPLVVHPSHFKEKIEIFIINMLEVIYKPFNNLIARFQKFDFQVEKVFIAVLIKVLVKLKIASIVQINEREQIYNRTLVVVDEAEKRGYTIKVVKIFNTYTDIFQLNLPNKSVFFYALPVLDFTENTAFDFDDKYKFKRFLKENGFPHATGESFKNVNSAINYGLKLGFPLVVKPCFGSLSRHTTINIKNIDELKRAIEIVKIITDKFIVEKYVAGENYRLVLVGNIMLACAFREPPNLVGDGIHTISQLVENKNSQFYRGESAQKNTTLRKINITTKTVELLKKLGYTQDTILEKNKKIYLDNKIILAAGADIHDATHQAYKANIQLLERLSAQLKTSLAGFDVIASDISRPYYETPFVIIEANSAPYIDMHHFPTSGESHNVAAAILDAVENRYNLTNLS